MGVDGWRWGVREGRASAKDEFDEGKGMAFRGTMDSDSTVAGRAKSDESLRKVVNAACRVSEAGVAWSVRWRMDGWVGADLRFRTA